MHQRAGFTLIELLMVIVLLGIVATVSVRFVSLSTQGALDVSARQLRAFQGVVVSEQITRELREAFALSVRTSGDCIEWLPLEAGTNYVRLTRGPAFDQIDVAAFANLRHQRELQLPLLLRIDQLRLEHLLDRLLATIDLRSKQGHSDTERNEERGAACGSYSLLLGCPDQVNRICHSPYL